MTKSIDEWAAEKCGVEVSQKDTTKPVFSLQPVFIYKGAWYQFEWTIKDQRCREIVRERYRKKGWMITFTMHSVIYHLPATEQDHETYCYTRDSEEECITVIYEAEK